MPKKSQTTVQNDRQSEEKARGPIGEHYEVKTSNNELLSTNEHENNSKESIISYEEEGEIKVEKQKHDDIESQIPKRNSKIIVTPELISTLEKRSKLLTILKGLLLPFQITGGGLVGITFTDMFIKKYGGFDPSSLNVFKDPKFWAANAITANCGNIVFIPTILLIQVIENYFKKELKDINIDELSAEAKGAVKNSLSAILWECGCKFIAVGTSVFFLTPVIGIPLNLLSNTVTNHLISNAHTASITAQTVAPVLTGISLGAIFHGFSKVLKLPVPTLTKNQLTFAFIGLTSTYLAETLAELYIKQFDIDDPDEIARIKAYAPTILGSIFAVAPLTFYILEKIPGVKQTVTAVKTTGHFIIAKACNLVRFSCLWKSQEEQKPLLKVEDNISEEDILNVGGEQIVSHGSSHTLN